MSKAKARRTDPWTSWAAAHGIDVKPSEAAVLWLFGDGNYARPIHRLADGSTVADAMTLEEIVEAVQGMASVLRAPSFSDSRIRTATSVLVRSGLLMDTGLNAPSRRGNPCRLIARRPPRPEQGSLL